MFASFRSGDPGTIRELQDEVNRLLNRLWHAGINAGPFDGQDWAPPWDVFEDDAQYCAVVELCGMDPKDIDVTCVGQTLTIRGTRPEYLHQGASPRYIRRERRHGAFMRTIDFHDTVESDKVAASCRNGLLTVTLPKKIDPAKRTVHVEVSGD